MSRLCSFCSCGLSRGQVDELVAPLGIDNVVAGGYSVVTEETGGIMKEITASIRELKSRLSHYLRLAKRGQIVEITERGKPLGRIVPVVSPLEDRLEAAIRSGLVSWNGRRLHPRVPVAKVRRSKTVAGLVVEGRR
jgi:prevent-host-death family protein